MKWKRNKIILDEQILKILVHNRLIVREEIPAPPRPPPQVEISPAPRPPPPPELDDEEETRP